MLSVTENAMKICSATKKRLSESQSDSECLRLVTDQNGGLAVTFAKPEKEDELIQYEGETVLAVPKKIASSNANKTLDIGKQGNLKLG